MGEHPVVTWYRAAVAAAWGGGRARDAKRRGVAYAPVRGTAAVSRKLEQRRHTFAQFRRGVSAIKGHKVAKHKEQRDAAMKRWRAAHGTQTVTIVAFDPARA